MIKTVKKPCIGCVYFNACGETNRTMPCEGRQTKSDKEREAKDDKVKRLVLH